MVADALHARPIMVADALLFHPSVTHFQKFVATTVGRDKLLRTIQYFARFYAWYLYRLNASPADLAPWSVLKSQLSLARKAFRLGKFIEHFVAASRAYTVLTAASTTSSSPSASSAFLGALTVGRQLGYAGYMLCDNAAFLDQVGAWKSETGKVAARRASQFWLMGLACSAVGAGWQTVTLKLRESEVRSGSKTAEKGEDAVELKKIARERSVVNTQLLSDICDMAIPASALSYGYGYLDDGIVGLAGTVSSLVGVTAQWSKTA